jgi:acetyl esterase/lipase
VPYALAIVSAWLALSAATALRPSRRGVFAALAFPVGWAAGELPVQALVVEAALVGAQAGLGWPGGALGPLDGALAALVGAENLALVAVGLKSRSVVRRAMASSPRRPLSVPGPGEDRYGTWWRTALQWSFHPRGLEIAADLAYGPEPRHRLDVWRLPGAGPDAPVVFYLHGGSWVFGDKRQQGRPMLHELVARGWVVVTANYRLAPAHPWPAQMRDVVRSLDWVKRHVTEFGGDPDRVVVAGLSAGGHLAALAALAADDPAWRPEGVGSTADLAVRGAISFAGVLEMTGDEDHWRGLGRGLRHLLEHRVVQVPFAGNEGLYRSISPYHRITDAAPPFLVIQGTTDTLVDAGVARAFVERFRAVALAPIYHVELPFAQHSFDLTASPRTSATTRAAVAFAESVVARRPHLDEPTLASYRVPPTELLVEVDARLLPATEAAARLGRFSVVTADNPFSRDHGEANDARRADLAAVLAARGLSGHATLARDPSGRWPDEEGVALVDAGDGLARRLAHAFDQFAYYDVTGEGVAVRDALSGREL